MNILCVEDDLMTQTMIGKLIKKLIPNANVAVETHAMTAMLYSIFDDPDFYILDWSLPFFDTSYIIDTIAKQKKPILIYTALDLEYVYNQIVKKCGSLPEGLTLCQKPDSATLINFIKQNIV
jgi:DNA-binding response OmpR family regulator